MNEQYNARLVVISPCSAILVIRTISTKVSKTIAMKTTKSMRYNIGPNTVGNHKIIKKEKRKTIPAPNRRVMPIIATQLKLLFANKAITASKPMIKEVMPKATPNNLQSMNIVNVDNRTPINVT